ncbi:hypothetical protein ACS0TY_016242 [Phlomoides rotata]
MLQQPFEAMLNELTPSPTCIICDKHITWTADTCHKLRISRIVFDGMSCFTQLVTHYLYISKIYQSVPPNEPFVVPYLSDKIEFTRLQLPGLFNPSPNDVPGFRKNVKKTEVQAHGVVVNSFEELEEVYVEEFRTSRGGKVWCVGPLSLCRDTKENSHEPDPCLEWLDGRKAGVGSIESSVHFSGERRGEIGRDRKILKIGVGVGARGVVPQLGEEEMGVNTVTSDGIKDAILRVMDEREGCERRKRTQFFGEIYKRSVEEGGSSYFNITNLIQDIEELVKNKQTVDG